MTHFLPDPDGDPDLLTEDLAQTTRPDGRVVDVGWYSDGGADGAFTCVLVDGSINGWFRPIEKLVTRDRNIAEAWYISHGGQPPCG